MSEEEIYFTDLARIFIGEVPLIFFVEAFIRILFIYVLLVTSMRLMGNRMSALLTRNELVALVVLAAAVGIPVLSAERGLIPAFIIAAVVVLTERGVSALAFKHETFEKISQGDYSILVKNGVMQFDPMRNSRITRERLIAELRSKGIKHLGNIKRLYFEAGGGFTVIEDEEGGEPGLSIIPDWDKDFAGRQTKSKEVTVCHNCGNRKDSHKNGACDNCGADDWVEAIESPARTS